MITQYNDSKREGEARSFPVKLVWALHVKQSAFGIELLHCPAANHPLVVAVPPHSKQTGARLRCCPAEVLPAAHMFTACRGFI